MAEKERLKIGILFNFDPIWMGGIIYIQNLIRIMNFLDDNEKPHITLFYRKDLEHHIISIDYPYLSKIQWDFVSGFKGFVFSWLQNRNLFVDKILNLHKDLQGLFPVMDQPVRTKHKAKLVSWYADLQHKNYPHFFKKRKVLERDFRVNLVLKNADHLVVSSQAVLDDFNKFYHLKKRLNTHIFHFASVMEDFEDIDFDQIRQKYNLPEKYFIVCNQFHKHKNHQVVLKSLALLKNREVPVMVAMTGRFLDAPPTAYRMELKTFIEINNLNSAMNFLGVLPRNEQLLIIKNAQAVVQPSLFEGWSTVIEDAISLQVPVIASSLPVNMEQLGTKGFYFDPHDDEKLAELLASFPERNLNEQIYEPYEERVRKAAKSFVKIFED